MSFFYIADLHIGHANVIKFDNRPYSDLNEMHNTIERYCDHCGAPMTPSDVNDYGSLCETCYMKEYYGEN